MSVKPPEKLAIAFPDVCKSPMDVLGQMARQTSDRATLRILKAGLEAMLEQSARNGDFSHDRPRAISDLGQINARLGRLAGWQPGQPEYGMQPGQPTY